MDRTNVVSIRSLAINTMYDFTFTVNETTDANVCKLTPPSEFKFLPKDDIELITSLLMSYFLSSDIFVKSMSAKDANSLGFVPSELAGEKIKLSICKNIHTGYSFEQKVPNSIKGSAGELAIANSIINLLTEFEDSILNDSTSESIFL